MNKTQLNLTMFGCSDIDAYLESAKNSITYNGGKDMIIMSLLSDAQELIEMGSGEKARQTINITKYLLSEL